MFVLMVGYPIVRLRNARKLGLVSIKRSVVQSELGRMYCTANVKRAEHIGLVPCGCLLERGEYLLDWDELREIDAVILVREKQAFGALRYGMIFRVEFFILGICYCSSEQCDLHTKQDCNTLECECSNSAVPVVEMDC